MITVDLNGKVINGSQIVYSWECLMCDFRLYDNLDRVYQMQWAMVHLSVEHRIRSADYLKEGSMKVSYVYNNGGTSQAYLEEEPLSDGSYVGINKHTDIPVHLRPIENGWVTVCEREATPINVYLDEWDLDPKPEGCTCNERVTK